LAWEALRRVAEGVVWCLAASQQEAEALREFARRLPEIERPVVLQGDLGELDVLLAVRGETELQFDAAVGRSVVFSLGERQSAVKGAATLAPLVRRLAPHGVVSLAETLPRLGQRLYALVELGSLGRQTAGRLRDAEEAMYLPDGDPLLNWGEEELMEMLTADGLRVISSQKVEDTAELRVTEAVLARWFSDAPPGGRLSYSQRLAMLLAEEELQAVRDLFRRSLTGRNAPWRSVVALVVAGLP
jgi:putative ATPase